MATTKNPSSHHKRARKQPGRRASSSIPPQARGQRDGPAAFQDTVIEGLRVLGRSRSAARGMVRDAFESAQETLQSRVGNAREQAQETMDNIEALFQSRVQRVMRQMGVPTAEEIRVLTRRVSELNESVRKLSAGARVGTAARPAVGTKRRPPKR